MGFRLGIGNIDIRNQRFNWAAYWATQPEVLFFGLYSDISGGQMPNRVPGATDYLTVAGAVGSETYQCPNTAPYIAADTDYIWFRTDTTQRTTTMAELIEYDFIRTIIKYDNTAPYALRWIMILSDDFETARENKMRDSFDLSIWWSDVLSSHGNVKGNRGAGRSVWTPEFSPEFLSNKVLIIDPSKGVTITGSGISQILDYSGNNNHATQATDGSRPPLTPAALNGHPVITPDGSADFLTLTAPIQVLTNYTVFVVQKIEAGKYSIILGKAADDTYYWFISSGTTVRLRSGTSNTITWSPSPALSDGYHILEFHRSSVVPYNNYGADKGVPLTGDPIAAGGQLGTQTDLFKTSALLSGLPLAYLAIYSDDKSDADRTLVRNWLATRFAL